MKKITLGAALTLGTGLLLSACAPYPPGDCRYDNTCRNYPYDSNYMRNDTHHDRIRAMSPAERAEFVDADGNLYYRGTDGYYYRDRGYRGERYYYDNGYFYRYNSVRDVPPGGWHRPTQQENHPDKF